MFKIIAVSYFVWVLLTSLVTFLLYGWDKRQARLQGRRIPEARLHGLAWAGGWPGALVGQAYFRHKTQKTIFKLVTWCAAIVHVGGVLAILYFQFS